MALANFLTALEGEVLITVKNINGEEIIKFYSGTTALDDAIEARTVRQFKLTGADKITVILNDAV